WRRHLPYRIRVWPRAWSEHNLPGSRSGWAPARQRFSPIHRTLETGMTGESDSAPKPRTAHSCWQKIRCWRAEDRANERAATPPRTQPPPEPPRLRWRYLHTRAAWLGSETETRRRLPRRRSCKLSLPGIGKSTAESRAPSLRGGCSEPAQSTVSSAESSFV